METRRTILLPLLLALVVLLPSPAYANGAMGLALSLFPYSTWLIYVLATIAFEAWWIGRALGLPFRDALKRSLSANAVTLVLGVFASGIFGYMLYGAFGTALNPNPLGEAILLLTLGGVVSALIERSFWGSGVKVWRATFAAHLLGVPLALLILLAPARPYPGLESQARYRRFSLLIRSDVKRALTDAIQESECFPNVRTYPELLEVLRPKLHYFDGNSDLWAAAYLPSYGRFDTGESRRSAVEWNAAVAGRRIDDVPEPTWLLRYRSEYAGASGDGYVYALGWNGHDVQENFRRDPFVSPRNQSPKPPASAK